MEYPKERKLDGIYFRVRREEQWSNICFTDMTPEEKDMVTKDRSWEWMKSLAYRLADVVREIGDQLDIVGKLSFGEDHEQ